MSYKVRFRTIVEKIFIKKEDYIRGFGINSEHYNKVNKRREELGLKTRKDYSLSFEHLDRKGKIRIDGTVIKSKYHPYHDFMLYDTEKDVNYHIDNVCYQYHYGEIVTLIIREEGTRSHGAITWSILRGGDDATIEKVKKNNRRYLMKSID